MDKFIGIFDSGIGGLTVMKEIIKALPNENIIYLGDTARVPYGNKSVKTIKKYSLENALFLINQDIKLMVIACNTASAISSSFLKETLKVPIVDVIWPGAKKAAESTKVSKVCIIGTEATIGSGAYNDQIKKINQDVEIFSKACPLFVPLAEEMWDDEADEVCLNRLKALTVKRYLEEFKLKRIDTLVLGCTHYPLLKKTIEEFIGKSIKVVCPAEETAQEVARVLKKMNLLNNTGKKGKYKYFVTDASRRFSELGKIFLGIDVKEVNQINTLF